MIIASLYTDAQLRLMVVHERHELITLGFAVLVFLLTLFVSHLYDSGLAGDQSSDAVGRDMTQRSRHDGSARPASRPDRLFIG
jgi:hypothetical protein